MKAQGVVEALSFKGKGASAKIGNDWYGLGFNIQQDQIPFRKGDTIEFEYTERGQYKNLDLKSVKLAAGRPAAAAPANNGYQARDESRQNMINWQAARNSALHLAEIAVSKDLIPLGTKKSDQLDNLVAFVDEISQR